MKLGPIVARVVFVLATLTTFPGCQVAPVTALPSAPPVAEAQTLLEGDVLRITFPGTPAMEPQQIPIRRDGKINLPIVGEITAAGLTPTALEKELVGKYSTQLRSSEIVVTVVSSSFNVLVHGAVLRPGKITADHRLNILEAIIEAGGFDNTKANKKKVGVIRSENGVLQRYNLNVQDMLDGKFTVPFMLNPGDIIQVDESFVALKVGLEPLSKRRV